MKLSNSGEYRSNNGARSIDKWSLIGRSILFMRATPNVPICELLLREHAFELYL